MTSDERLSGILKDLQENAIASGNHSGGNELIDSNDLEDAVKSIKAWALECVGEDKPLYGGEIERTLCLPPEGEWNNKGYNLAKQEIRERIGMTLRNDRIFDKTHFQYIKWWHKLLLPFCKSYKTVDGNCFVITKTLFEKVFIVDSGYLLPKRIRND